MLTCLGKVGPWFKILGTIWIVENYLLCTMYIRRTFRSYCKNMQSLNQHKVQML